MSSSVIAAHGSSPGGSPGAALAATAASLSRAIVRALGHAGDRHRGVHQARKAIRRLRSLLALAQTQFGAALTPLDRALRQLGLQLSPLRDAHVVVAAAARLARTAGAHAADWNELSQQLIVQRDALLATALADDPRFVRRRAEVRTIAKAMAQLPWARVSTEHIKAALAHSQRRAKRAERKARQRATAERIHRWRRRLRRLRMQCEVLASLRIAVEVLPKQLAGHSLRKVIKTLNHRADQLGWQQDLVVLRTAIDALPQLLPSAMRKRLLRDIEQAAG
jgi:CHAD domain-containing protein